MTDPLTTDPRLLFLSGGNTARMLRETDWSSHPLGDPADWPEALKAALTIALNSGFPIAVYWGEQFHILYNDAYSPIPGDKHPWALTRPGAEAWADIWNLVDAQFDSVLNHHQSIRFTDSMLPMKRFGYVEECYFDYSLSPIPDTTGKVRGVFNATVETTYKVINERRNALLYSLALQSDVFLSGEQVFAEALNILTGDSPDIPFALLYKRDHQGNFSLTQAIHFNPAHAARIEWPFDKVTGTNRLHLIRDIVSYTGEIHAAHWPEPLMEAVLLPLNSGDAQLTGILVAGLNPGKRFDEDYRRFSETVAVHLNISINNATALDKERTVSSLVRRSEDELQFALNAAELGTFDLDPVTNHFSGNTRLKSWFGLAPDDEIPLSQATDVIDPADRPAVLHAIAQALDYDSGGNYDIEYTILNPLNPEPRMVRAKGKALFNEDRQVTRFSGTLQDITEERRSRLQLLQAGQRLEIALDAAQLGSFDLDLRTGHMICTPTCKANFGLPPEAEFHYPDLMHAIQPAFRESVRATIEEAIAQRQTYHAEYQCRWPDLSIHWISAHGIAQYDAEGRAARMVGVTSDITKKKIATQELEDAYEQTRLAKQAAELGTFDMDLLKGHLDWDERCRFLFGITHKDPVSFEGDFIPTMHPEDRDRVMEVIKRAYTRAVSDGEYNTEYRTIGQEDRKIRWVKARGRVMFNGQDEPVRFIGSVLDITEQKEDEMRKNDFIGMVSHELKTPLTSLKAYVQLLQENDVDGTDPFRTGALKKVDLQVNKMTTMINSFLNVARLESGKIQLTKGTFDMDNLLTEVVEELGTLYQAHTLILHECPPLPVHADRDKIQQVITNLISNAVKYSPKNTDITVACVHAGDEVVISVTDQGIGLHENDLPRIFTRFYRVQTPSTRTVAGFGIGLYLSAEIINRHDGRIWAESEHGKGSTFRFSIPVTLPLIGDR